MQNPLIPAMVRARIAVAVQRERIRNRMSDKGAGMVEYGALIVLAVAVLAAIVGTGMIENITDGVGDALEDLFDRDFAESEG